MNRNLDSQKVTVIVKELYPSIFTDVHSLSSFIIDFSLPSLVLTAMCYFYFILFPFLRSISRLTPI